jgi:hypothetical protein
MLSWTDRSTWCEEAWTCEWKFEPHAFTDAIHCVGFDRFVEVDGGTLHEIRGTLEIDLAAIRGVPRILHRKLHAALEDYIAKKLTPSLTDVDRALERHLHAVSAAPTPGFTPTSVPSTPSSGPLP